MVGLEWFFPAFRTRTTGKLPIYTIHYNNLCHTPASLSLFRS